MLLKLENVKKQYGTFTLDCSIEVKKGAGHRTCRK